MLGRTQIYRYNMKVWFSMLSRLTCYIEIDGYARYADLGDVVPRLTGVHRTVVCTARVHSQYRVRYIILDREKLLDRKKDR